MKIIVIAHRTATATPEAIGPLLEPEAKRALSMVAENVVREIHGRADGQGAILVFEAEDEAEVRAHLDTLPLAQNGYLAFDVYPVVPYRGIVNAAK